jgi:hypothetical protein
MPGFANAVNQSVEDEFIVQAFTAPSPELVSSAREQASASAASVS